MSDGAMTEAENEERSMELWFTIPGPPVPAVRMTQRSKWQPRAQHYLAWKGGVGHIAKAAGATCWDGPVMVEVNIYGVDDRISRTWDIDNVLKGVLDGLNGVCYRDDKQVTSASVRVYSRGEECVKVWVSPCT